MFAKDKQKGIQAVSFNGIVISGRSDIRFGDNCPAWMHFIKGSPSDTFKPTYTATMKGISFDKSPDLCNDRRSFIRPALMDSRMERVLRNTFCLVMEGSCTFIDRRGKWFKVFSSDEIHCSESLCVDMYVFIAAATEKSFDLGSKGPMILGAIPTFPDPMGNAQNKKSKARVPSEERSQEVI